jgi:hypothetical protein
MKSSLVLLLSIGVSVALMPNVSIAKTKTSVKAPIGYEGTPPQCWPHGKSYTTWNCCIKRGVARGLDRESVAGWCTRKGFTKKG